MITELMALVTIKNYFDPHDLNLNINTPHTGIIQHYHTFLNKCVKW